MRVEHVGVDLGRKLLLLVIVSLLQLGPRATRVLVAGARAAAKLSQHLGTETGISGQLFPNAWSFSRLDTCADSLCSFGAELDARHQGSGY